MTDKTKTRPQKHIGVKNGTAFFCIAIIFLLCMILRNSQVAIEYMQKGLLLCATSVIPSLFPFMVISELLVACGFGEFLGKYVGKPVGKIFGIPGEAGTPLLLGAVCGFPVGAKTAIALYDRGSLSQRELERVMMFCNVPSSGFLISAVGVSLYANRRFGTFLFLAALTASVLVGLGSRLLFPIPKETFLRSASTPRVLAPSRVISFTKAISSATASVLSVCACVLFFTSLVGCLTHLLSTFSVSPLLEAMLFCLFEISSGVSAAAILESAEASAAICGFAVGWSGISVHFQILSLGCDRGISFKPYLISKFCQGLFCAAASWFYVRKIDPHLLTFTQSTAVFPQAQSRTQYVLLSCLLFLICTMLYYRRKRNFWHDSL